MQYVKFRKPIILIAILFLISLYHTVFSLFDELHQLFTLISLGSTWPGILICFLVLKSWHVQYMNYCTTKQEKPSLTLIAGVYIGFFGSLIDNLYWGFAWSLDYLNHSWRDFFFHNGVYPNVLFRQGALIWAGLLHVSSENMSRETNYEVYTAQRKTKVALYVSVLIGLVYISILYMLMH